MVLVDLDGDFRASTLNGRCYIDLEPDEVSRVVADVFKNVAAKGTINFGHFQLLLSVLGDRFKGDERVTVVCSNDILKDVSIAMTVELAGLENDIISVERDIWLRQEAVAASLHDYTLISCTDLSA